MIAVRLAYRNLLRNKRRSILTSLALSIALVLLVFFYGLMDGMEEQSLRNFISYDYAHMKAYIPGYLEEDFPGLEDHSFTAPDSLLNYLEQQGEDIQVTARLEMSGMAMHGREEIFVRVIGVDPKRDKEVFETLEALSGGVSLTDDREVALIGDRLARDLNVEVGQMATILVRSKPGALNPRMLPIAGILRTGHPKVDQFSVYVPLSLARKMALFPDGATEIAVLTKSKKTSPEVAEYLATVLPDLEWHTWKSLAADFLAMIKFKKVGQAIMMGILALMAAVGVANTMVMSVHERTREIGTLRAMGFTPQFIGNIFLLEGLMLGIAAGLVGITLGVILTAWVGINGWSMERYGEMDIGVPIRDAIYPTIQAGSITITFLIAVFLALFASWSSARMAARGHVVRALKEGKL
jgi:putative ABC transport system permease protein